MARGEKATQRSALRRVVREPKTAPPSRLAARVGLASLLARPRLLGVTACLDDDLLQRRQARGLTEQERDVLAWRRDRALEAGAPERPSGSGGWAPEKMSPRMPGSGARRRSGRGGSERRPASLDVEMDRLAGRRVSGGPGRERTCSLAQAPRMAPVDSTHRSEIASGWPANAERLGTRLSRARTARPDRRDGSPRRGRREDR